MTSRKTFFYSTRAYYEDVDMAGIVYHSNYLKFMERARTERLRETGINQTVLKQDYHFVFAIKHIVMDYLKPAVFNDLLQVTAQIVQLGKASMTFSQQILCQEESLCTATVKIAGLNTDNFRPQRFPPPLLTTLQRLKMDDATL